MKVRHASAALDMPYAGPKSDFPRFLNPEERSQFLGFVFDSFVLR
jgi:hypothetical protein